MRTLPLHDVHAREGARFGERGGAEIVLGHADPAAEHRALAESVGLADRSYRALLTVTGPEAKLYLHGMVTNEVKGLQPGQGNYAAVITARGKMLGDGRVLLRQGDQLVFDLEPGSHAQVYAHLDQFLISEDCELADATGALAILGVYGPRAAETIGGLPSSLPLHHHVDLPIAGVVSMIVAAAPYGVPGFDVYVPAQDAAIVWQSLQDAVHAAGGTAVGEEALEAARIRHGIPRYGVDTDENTIPLEANLESAISYTKGCYVGQEVIAKATYRGQVRRKLARLEVPAGTRAGASLLDGEKSVGVLTSVLDPDPAGGPPMALGYVRRDRLAVGAKLALEGGGEATITWAPPEKES